MGHDLDSRLRGLRAEAGLSARELDELAGLGAGHVSMIETRKRLNLTRAVSRGIARVLGCTVGWLLEGEGAPPTPDEVLAAVERARKARDPNTIADEADAHDPTGPVACPPIDVLEDPRPSMTGTDGR